MMSRCRENNSCCEQAARREKQAAAATGRQAVFNFDIVLSIA
jgi:hypothetical protein